MTGNRSATMLTLFILGWVTYVFTLFDVGRFSITLLLLVSSVLALSGLASKNRFSFPVISLLTSSLLAWAIACYSYPDIEKTFTHLIQCLLGVGVMVGSQSLDWDNALPRFRKAVFWIAGIVLVYGVYQFFARKHGLPFAFLPITNIQLGSDDGLQRGVSNVLLGAGDFTRVSSFFAEPSDFGRFMLWVFALGYGCKPGRSRLSLMGIGVAGVLISQSMGGLVGLLFLVVVVTVLKRDVRRSLMCLALGAAMLAALIRFFPLAFETLETRAEQYLIIREERLLQEKRFADVCDNVQVFLDAPFLGHGLASYLKEIPDHIVASAWELLLIERGLLGTALFMAPYFWAFSQLGLRGGKSNEIRNTALMLLIVEIYCFATFSSVFFPSTYVAIGFALFACAYVPSNDSEAVNP